MEERKLPRKTKKGQTFSVEIFIHLGHLYQNNQHYLKIRNVSVASLSTPLALFIFFSLSLFAFSFFFSSFLCFRISLRFLLFVHQKKEKKKKKQVESNNKQEGRKVGLLEDGI